MRKLLIILSCVALFFTILSFGLAHYLIGSKEKEANQLRTNNARKKRWEKREEEPEEEEEEVTETQTQNKDEELKG